MLKQLSFVWLTQVFDQSSLTLGNFESGAWAYNKLRVIAKLGQTETKQNVPLTPAPHSHVIWCYITCIRIYL